MSLRNEENHLLKHNEVVINVKNVSKKFSKSLKRSMIYGMKDI